MEREREKKLEYYTFLWFYACLECSIRGFTVQYSRADIDICTSADIDICTSEDIDICTAKQDHAEIFISKYKIYQNCMKMTPGDFR